jgi:hypothetical protein
MELADIIREWIKKEFPIRHDFHSGAQITDVAVFNTMLIVSNNMRAEISDDFVVFYNRPYNYDNDTTVVYAADPDFFDILKNLIHSVLGRK